MTGTLIFDRMRPKTVFFDRNQPAKRVVLPCETAHIAVRNGLFGIVKRHISQNGMPSLSRYFTPRGFSFSISAENGVLNFGATSS